MKNGALIIGIITAIVNLFQIIDQIKKGEPITFWNSWRIILLSISMGLGFYFFFFPITEPKIPRLDINQGPAFLFKTGDSIKIYLSVANYGNGVADTIIDYKFEVLQADSLFVTGKKFNRINPDDYSLQPTQSETFFMNLDTTKFLPHMTEFVCFELLYKDDKGAKQPPFKTIFKIPFPKPGELIYNLKPDEDRRIRQYLTANNLWL